MPMGNTPRRSSCLLSSLECNVVRSFFCFCLLDISAWLFCSIDYVVRHRGWCIYYVCANLSLCIYRPIFSPPKKNSFVGLGEDPQVLAMRAPELFRVRAFNVPEHLCLTRLQLIAMAYPGVVQGVPRVWFFWCQFLWIFFLQQWKFAEDYFESHGLWTLRR